MSFCLKELNEKASLDHGQSIFGQAKILYSNYGQCTALQNLCVERKNSAAIHRGFWLLKQSFCQRGTLSTSHVFASEPIRSIF